MIDPSLQETVADQTSAQNNDPFDTRASTPDDEIASPGDGATVATAAAPPQDSSDHARESLPADRAEREHAAPRMRGFAFAEIATCIALILWIQVVGVVTERVATHIVHALPFVLLLGLPKGGWARVTNVVTCLFWIFALSLMSPMVRNSIVEGGIWREGGMFVWLAPGVAFLCAVSIALNLTILVSAARWSPVFLIGALLLIPALALLRPIAHTIFTVPVSGILTGQPMWVAALIVELVCGVTLFSFATVRLTRRTDLRWTHSVMLWQGVYWAFFVGCTAIGVPYAAFPGR